MTIWLLLNSIGLLLLTFVLYLVVRQLGFLLHRVGPSGARASEDGPRIGENLSSVLLPLKVAATERKPTLLVFGSYSCSICSAIRSASATLARHWAQSADIFLIYDCDNGLANTELSQVSPGLYIKRDCEMRLKLDASFVPFAIIVNREGIVIGKGLVNEIGHLESLLELERVKAVERKQDLPQAEAFV